MKALEGRVKRYKLQAISYKLQVETVWVLLKKKAHEEKSLRVPL